MSVLTFPRLLYLQVVRLHVICMSSRMIKVIPFDIICVTSHFNTFFVNCAIWWDKISNYKHINSRSCLCVPQKLV